LEAKLLYDFDKPEDSKMEVSYVKHQPLEYKVNISESGLKAIVEIKIKVLTSQHEDMLFRIRFSAVDPVTNLEFQVFSEPIKVISKLTQLSKKKDPVLAKQSKRTSNDQIAISLEKLERQQYEHSRALEVIKNALIDPHSHHSLTNSSHLVSLSPLSHNSNPSIDFDVAFKNFIFALHRLPPEEKHDRIFNVIHSITPKDADRLFEFTEIIGSSPKRQKMSHPSPSNLLSLSLHSPSTPSLLSPMNPLTPMTPMKD